MKEKGYKLGVQASSDHVSTHISYAGFYVDRIDRDSIIAAMKARRSYAGTDNIFADLRMGSRFMGESFPLALTVVPWEGRLFTDRKCPRRRRPLRLESRRYPPILS